MEKGLTSLVNKDIREKPFKLRYFEQRRKQIMSKKSTLMVILALAGVIATTAPLLAQEVYLVGADYYGRSNYILCNLDGTFSSQQYMGQVPQPYYSYGNGIGDFDNDGDFDYIIGTGYYTSDPHHVYLYEKLGAGNTFAAPVSVDTWTEGGYSMDMPVADYNNDGNMDFVLTHYASPNCELYLGNGNLTFNRSILYSTAPTYGIGADAGDFNNDGNADFVACQYSNSNPDPGEDIASDTTGHNPYYLYINLGNGDGTFTTSSFLASSNSWGVTAGDFDNDGNEDIITDGYWSTTNFYFYRGNGDGTFQSGVVASGLTNPGMYPTPLDNFDLNNDDNMDVVIGYGNYIRCYSGNGDGTFNYVTQITGGTGYSRYCLSAPPGELIPPGSPVADADPDAQSVTVGGTASFDGSNSYDTDGGTIVSYQWDFGDGTTGTGVTTSHPYITENTYRVRLTVTDNDGKTGTNYVTVTVQGDPPVADANGPYIGHQDSPLTFDGSGSTDDYGITSYVWDFGDGNTGTGITPAHIYTSQGTFTVTLTVTDAAGQTSTSTTAAEIAGPPTYYVYGVFTPSHEVYSIDGYDDLLYVSDNYGYAYIYRVTIPAGADPNMHPDNPDATGPMAPRTFTQVGSRYYFRGDCGWYGYHHASFYVDQDYIYYGPDNYGQGGIEKWARNPDGTFGAYLGRLPVPVPPTNGETFGYDADNDTWYTCTRERAVYSFQMGVDAVWQYEFTYPSYGGDHHDGLEFVGGFLFLSDMTTDLIGQWEYTGTGPYNGWEEAVRYQYANPQYVEGMGFSPFDHLWISSGWSPGVIYELGGGELQVALEGIPDQCIYVGESFETFDLKQYVVGHPPFTWSWSGNVDLTVSVDAEDIATVTYPDGWWGSETVTFTVTDSIGRSASDEAIFTVCPVPVVLDIPDQNWPFPPFDLDDYLDPNCGVDPEDVTWTASGMVYFVVEIDPGTHVVTVTNPTGSTESETLTFTATAAPCCAGKPEASDSDIATFNMLGAICGDVTHDNGDPVANVTVKVIDSDNNQVGDPIVTGSDGTFYFDSLLVGTYSVMIVTPLGYSVSPSETQTDIEVTGYPCTEVYFVLTPTITSNDCRTIGYWKHQFDVYLSGRGRAQEDSADLEGYLDLVHLHFNVLGVYIDLENFNFEDAKNVLTVSGGKLMEDRAKQQLFALLLNFASGRIGNETVVSDDGRVAAEAVTYVAILINDGDPEDDELAKTIGDLINNGQQIGAGIIPESPERYRVAGDAGTPREYALDQNYPNPFNATTQISYSLPRDGHVKLEIYNLLGQKVATLVDECQQAGLKTANWNAEDLASGIYFYRLTADDFTTTRKMLLMK